MSDIKILKRQVASLEEQVDTLQTEVHELKTNPVNTSNVVLDLEVKDLILSELTKAVQDLRANSIIHVNNPTTPNVDIAIEDSHLHSEYEENTEGTIARVKIPYYILDTVGIQGYTMKNLTIANCLEKTSSPIIMLQEVISGTLNLSGMGVMGSLVVIYDNGVLLGHTKVDNNGQWKFTHAGFKTAYKLFIVTLTDDYLISKESEVTIGDFTLTVNLLSSHEKWKSLLSDSAFKAELELIK